DQFLSHWPIVPEIRRDSPIEVRKALGALGGDHWHQLRGGDVESRFEIRQHFRLEPLLQLIFTFAQGVSLAHVQRVKLFEGKLEIMGYKFNCAKLRVIAFFAGRPDESDMPAVFREFEVNQIQTLRKLRGEAGFA